MVIPVLESIPLTGLPCLAPVGEKTLSLKETSKCQGRVIPRGTFPFTEEKRRRNRVRDSLRVNWEGGSNWVVIKN